VIDPARLIPYSAEVYGVLVADMMSGAWPWSVALGLAAAAMPILVGVGRGVGRDVGPRSVPAILAVLWLCVAWLFYWDLYAPLNWAGVSFFWLAMALSIGFAGLAAWPCRDRRPPAAPRRIAAGLVVLAGIALSGHLPGLTPLGTLSATAAAALLVADRRWLMGLPVLVPLLGWEVLRAWVLSLSTDMALAAITFGALVLAAAFRPSAFRACTN